MLDNLETKVFVGQKAFINRGGKILVLRDPDYVVSGQKGLDFPGGRFRWGSSPIDELLREVDEETGLKIKVYKPFYTWTNLGHFKKDPNQVFYVGYLCDWLSGEVVLSEEHDNFEWVDRKTFIKWRENSPIYKALEYYFITFSKLKSGT